MSDWFTELFIEEAKTALTNRTIELFMTDDGEGNVTIWINKDTLGWLIS